MVLSAMAVLSSLVATSIGVIVGTFAWRWRNGTLKETAQERFDREFDRITQRLGVLR
jgi:hypothetical protein